MPVSKEQIEAQAASYAATDAANRGPRHAGISDEDLCKALRHRAGLPETCATDSYVMMQAEQRIKLQAAASVPPDSGKPAFWHNGMGQVLTPEQKAAQDNVCASRFDQPLYAASKSYEDGVAKLISELDAAMRGHPGEDAWWQDCATIRKRLALLPSTGAGK